MVLWELKEIKSRVTRCLLALFYYLTAWQHRTQQQHCGAKTMVCVLTESNFLAKIFKQSIKSQTSDILNLSINVQSFFKSLCNFDSLGCFSYSNVYKQHCLKNQMMIFVLLYFLKNQTQMYAVFRFKKIFNENCRLITKECKLICLIYC